MKKNKRLIVAGIISIIYHSFFVFILLSQGSISSFFTGILTILASIALTIYCFTYSKKRINHIAYIISFVLVIGMKIGEFISIGNLLYGSVTRNIIYPYYLLIYLLFILIKVKKNNFIAILGSILLYIPAVFVVIICVGSYYGLLITILSIGNIVPLLLIWSNETKELFQKTKPRTAIETEKFSSLENDLRKLSVLFDNGKITEEQYKYMKQKILSKL